MTRRRSEPSNGFESWLEFDVVPPSLGARMSRHPMIACLASCLLLAATPARGQQPPAQDSTLNNLVHAPDYVTALLGSLGAVVERGRGPIDMVLVSGSGMGASVFEGFMRRNADRYHMLAVTLPGFEGTP